ncbi:hypothetical protein AB0M43_26685 [Longispora sp. NPDC051575]|uniref:hypothetical protein n=1 Tax=Longispora sp. NPDC051575 TaxID=3154943 RepID=UPI00344691B6
MAKERAKKRAARLAEGQERRLKAERKEARRRRLRALFRPRRRGTGRISPRRSRAERAGIVLVAAALMFLTWFYLDSFPAQLAITLLLLVASPALIVMTLDRRTR